MNSWYYTILAKSEYSLPVPGISVKVNLFSQKQMEKGILKNLVFLTILPTVILPFKIVFGGLRLMM